MYAPLCFCVSISRSHCSMRETVSGGTLVEDLWLLPTGSWLLLTASSMGSKTQTQSLCTAWQNQKRFWCFFFYYFQIYLEFLYPAHRQLVSKTECKVIRCKTIGIRIGLNRTRLIQTRRDMARDHTIPYYNVSHSQDYVEQTCVHGFYSSERIVNCMLYLVSI